MIHSLMPTPKRRHYFLALFTAGIIPLLAVPCAAWLFGWQWSPPVETPAHLFVLYLITETGSFPYALATSAAIMGILIYLHRHHLQPVKLVLLAVIIAMTLCAGQVLKSIIKNVSQEPRPYAVWLEQEQQNFTTAGFYALDSKARSAFLAQQNLAAQGIPAWQQAHWVSESGYTFPSGHSMFVAQWALMLLLLLWPLRAYALSIIFMAWACAVEASRILLGMHWPVDVFTGTCIAAITVAIAAWCLQRWVFNPAVPLQTEATPPRVLR